MAGHSKWANIKHRKSAVDAKRAKVFTKLIKEITIAAKVGGDNPDGNPRLRLAIDKARSQSLPKDKIEKAIQKGAGSGDGDHLEEMSYEGYGPSGVAILVDCATDNKNRTVAEVRSTFSKRGGNLGENGSVSWMFEKLGMIRIAKDIISEEELFEKALEAGGDDVSAEGETFTVTSSFEDFHKAIDSLKEQEVKILEDQSGIEMVPKNTVQISDEETAQKVLNLVEALEDIDDVQNVWANFDMDDSLLEKLGG